MTRSLCPAVFAKVTLVTAFSALFIFAASGPIHAEDQQAADIMPGLRRRALMVDINARVLEEKQVVVWNENHTKLTIPGNPVGIKLVGSNVVVALQFTPFVRRGGQHLLVAQGQIWIDDPEKGICYYTSILTFPLEFGEPIYFFPLGSSQQLNSSIEIILTVNPYSDTGVPSARAETATETHAESNNEN
ncbi:MAG: hypothetical protein LBH16_08945 [Treponema sp.]|jgi:hypothetical protein|nr:hypothetical protein [Treponema sp.]